MGVTINDESWYGTMQSKLSDELLGIRIKHNLDKHRMAILLGLSDEDYSLLESGSTKFTVEQYDKYIEKLELNPDINKYAKGSND